MAQKKSVDQPKQETILTISNSSFKTQLEDRLKQGDELLNIAVDNSSVEQFQSQYRQWNDYNFEMLKRSFNITANEFMDSYNHAGFTFLGQMGEVPNQPVLSTKNLIKYKIENLKSLLNRADLIKSEHLDKINKPFKSLNMTEVFVVHGHDDLAKTKAARFIEQLGLKPIVLHEQSSSGRTIIEKIEEYTNVGFGIILYTACDVGGKDPDNLKARARQNVVFEHGYLMGKIGRRNICAVVKGDIETPSDISGVVYTQMDNHDAWHFHLAKELRSAGYQIDMNKI